MLAGELFLPSDPEILADLAATARWIAVYNAAIGEPEDVWTALLRQHLPAVGTNVIVRPPFFCDYGYNIRLGLNVFLNFNCVILDGAEVSIGDHTRIGPAVQIYTATHPANAELRQQGYESNCPVNIGKNVWIGGGAIILPGVTIGDNAIVGAGSVVTRDVPVGGVAVGNPARLRDA